MHLAGLSWLRGKRQTEQDRLFNLTRQASRTRILPIASLVNGDKLALGFRDGGRLDLSLVCPRDATAVVTGGTERYPAHASVLRQAFDMGTKLWVGLPPAGNIRPAPVLIHGHRLLLSAPGRAMLFPELTHAALNGLTLFRRPLQV